jgi:hypothetical protein
MKPRPLDRTKGLKECGLFGPKELQQIDREHALALEGATLGQVLRSPVRGN